MGSKYQTLILVPTACRFYHLLERKLSPSLGRNREALFLVVLAGLDAALSLKINILPAKRWLPTES